MPSSSRYLQIIREALEALEASDARKTLALQEIASEVAEGTYTPYWIVGTATDALTDEPFTPDEDSSTDG